MSNHLDQLDRALHVAHDLVRMLEEVRAHGMSLTPAQVAHTLRLAETGLDGISLLLRTARLSLEQPAVQPAPRRTN